MKLKKAKPIYIPFPRFIRHWMETTAIGILFRSWLTQAFFYMTPLEKITKVCLTIVYFGGFWLIFAKIGGTSMSVGRLVAVFIITHTVSWLFSGQFLVTMTYLGYQTSPEKMQRYIRWLESVCRNRRFLKDVLLYGSLVRGTISATSDLDVRVISGSGRADKFLAVLFTNFLRLHSFFLGIPLDVFLFDRDEQLARMNPKERPISLCHGDLKSR